MEKQAQDRDNVAGTVEPTGSSHALSNEPCPVHTEILAHSNLISMHTKKNTTTDRSTDRAVMQDEHTQSYSQLSHTAKVSQVHQADKQPSSPIENVFDKNLVLNIGDKQLTNVVISPNERFLLALDETSQVRLLCIKEWKMRILRHSGVVSCAAFSPRFNLLITGMKDTGHINYWSTTSCKLYRSLERAEAGISHIAFSPTACLIAIASRGRVVMIMDTIFRRVTRKISAHIGEVYQVAFSYDGKYLASIGEDHQLCVWGVSDGRMMLRMQSNNGVFSSVAFSPSGYQLVVGNEGGNLLMIAMMKNKSVLRKFARKTHISSLRFICQGQYVVFFGGGRRLYLCETKKLAILATIPLASGDRFVMPHRHLLAALDSKGSVTLLKFSTHWKFILEPVDTITPQFKASTPQDETSGGGSFGFFPLDEEGDDDHDELSDIARPSSADILSDDSPVDYYGYS